MTSPLATAEVEAIREQLPATHGVAYLNAGTLGPLPRLAVEAMEEQLRYDMDHRQSLDHWDRLASLQREARAALTSLTGVGPGQVALMHSTHEGLNACLWGLDLRDGDNVVTTDEEHPGLLVPLAHARARSGCDVRVSTWWQEDAAFVDGILAEVDGRTRAVFLSHVSWTSGRTAPLRLLRAALPGHVRIVADGAQSAGVLTVDPSDGWDAYTVSGQKWPCGPNGSGGLALLDPEAWQPTFGAYAQLASWDDYISTDVVVDGRRFETSQEALAPLAGFAASVRWLVTEVGLSQAHRHARTLNARARTRLRSSGVDDRCLHGDDHLLGVDVPAGAAPGLAAALYERGCLVRNLGADRIRLSFGCWNTDADVDRCIDALLEQLGG